MHLLCLWSPDGCWKDAWVSILKCGTTRWRFNVNKSITGHRSSSTPEKAGCRTREKTHWELSLWLPWTAGHPRPAGDPGSCSWSGTRCCDGWIEVDRENCHPPLPQQCWWPGRCPTGFATGGQSLPGEPLPVPRQRRPAHGAWAAPEVFRWWETVWASPAGSCMKGLCVLSDSPLYGRRLVGSSQTIANRHPGLLRLARCRLLTGLGRSWFLGWFLECDRRPCHSVSLSDVPHTLL